MKNKKAIAVLWVLSLAPVALVALFWSRLPELVPTHWNLDGSVSYSDRTRLWFLAAVPVLFALLYQFMPRLDPKGKNYAKFQGLYDFLGPVFSLLFLALMAITLSEALCPGVLPVGRVVCMAVSVLLIILGNLMGKLKTSWFIGFRTPWTLSDPDVWNKANRLGGKVFFFTGLIALVLGAAAPEPVAYGALFLLLLGGVAVCYFMSWKWYREKQI